jgi:hypothetical protein
MKKLKDLKKRFLKWFEGTGDELDLVLHEDYLEIT